MADIAELGFKADTSGLVNAETALDGVTRKAGETEKATNGVVNGFTKGKGAASNFANEVSNGSKSLNVMSVAASGVTAALKYVFAAMSVLAPLALAAFSIEPLMRFHDALAEVTTLVDTTTFDMGKLANAALDFSAKYGGGAVKQVEAFNDIISAGNTDLVKASEILDASNKLAIGGATSVGVATDGLTNILGAYGDKVKSVTDVSDAMFIGVRDGKMKIDEFASSVGKAAPIAAQAGVSFDELTSAVAALTLQGLTASESVTGVRSMLTAILKPTSQATAEAKALGLEFNASALKTKGFAGFLADVMEKTHGSTDALAVLFSDVQALNAALAFSGTAGEAMNATLEHMATKAGATQEAFDKMTNSPGFQAGRVWSALEAEVLRTASAFAGPLTAALKFIADNMGAIVTAAKFVSVALIVLFGPTLVAMIGTATAAVWAFTAAIASNPIGLLAVGISAAIAYLTIFGTDIQWINDTLSLLGETASFVWNAIVEGVTWLVQNVTTAFQTMSDYVTSTFQLLGAYVAPAWEYISSGARAAADTILSVFSTLDSEFSSIFSRLGDFALIAFGTVMSYARSAANTVIGAFKSAIEIIGALWSALPGVVAQGVNAAVNVVISGVNIMIAKAVAGLNMLVGAVNAALSAVGAASRLGTVGVSEIGKVGALPKDQRDDPQPKGALGALGDNVGNIVSGNMSTDYIANIKKGADALALARQNANDATTAIGDLAKTSTGAGAAVADLGNAAAGPGTGGAGTGGSGKKGGAAGKIHELKDAAQEAAKAAADFIKGLFKSAIDDLIKAAEDGKITMKELAKIALDSLNKIADKLIDMALNKLFENALGGMGPANSADPWAGMRTTGSGGILGNVISWFAGLFAKGDVFRNGTDQKFASGSVVTRPTQFGMSGGRRGLMGEAGPEGILPLTRLSNGDLGVQSSGGAGGGNVQIGDVHVHYNLSGAIDGQTIQRQLAETAQSTAEATQEAVKRKMMGWINEFSDTGGFVSS